LEAALMLG